MTVQLADVPSNFDVNSELVAAWGTGAIPPSALPDVVGAFRFICNASHLSYDDPIVYPVAPIDASKNADKDAFVKFLHGPEATKIFKDAGFTTLSGS